MLSNGKEGVVVVDISWVALVATNLELGEKGQAGGGGANYVHSSHEHLVFWTSSTVSRNVRI